MNEKYVAREQLLVAALQLVATRLHQESQNTPGAYDDAQAELCSDLLDTAVLVYSAHLEAELEEKEHSA